MTELRNYLEGMAESWARLKAPAIMERFVVRNGKPFKGRKLPRSYDRDEAKQCFSNAGRLALMENGLRYVEGYVIGDNLPIAIHHAWLIDAKGKVVDTTLKNPERYQYLGVVVGTDALRKEV